MKSEADLQELEQEEHSWQWNALTVLAGGDWRRVEISLYGNKKGKRMDANVNCT